jgi:hypothetical protein
MKIITRAEAKSQGLKRYFTGEPCIYGHISERYASAKQCVECSTNRGKSKKEMERCVRKNAAYRAERPGMNPANVSYSRAKYAGLLCDCCKKEDFHAIYIEAADLGHEVDHRHPKHLGGLHCMKNLQILTKAAHKEKSNGELSDAAFERAMAVTNKQVEDMVGSLPPDLSRFAA